MNRNTFSSLYKTLSVAFPILGAVIALSYFFALKNDFDYSIEHFESGSVWFWIFAVASVIAAALSLALAILPKKTVAIVKVPAPTPLSLFGALFSIIMAIGVFISEIRADSASLLSSADRIGGALALFVALSFALSCVEKYRCGAAHRLSAILAAVSMNITMFACYFNFTQPLNGPVRNITTIIQCAMILFLISELRLSFGVDGKKITSMFYIFSSCAAASLGFGFSLGAIIYKIVCNEAGDPNQSLLRLGLYIAIAVVAMDRMLALPKIAGDPVPEEKAK